MSFITFETRPLRIQWLIRASTILSLAIFGCSKVLPGTTTLSLSPIAVALTLAFNITLLVLSAKERKKKLNPKNYPKDKTGTDVESTPMAAVVSLSADPKVPELLPPSPPPLPATFRSETIVFGLFLVVFWLSAAMISICVIIIAEFRGFRPMVGGHFGFNGWDWGRMGLFASFAEILLMLFQMYVLLTLCHVCEMERKYLYDQGAGGQASRAVGSAGGVTTADIALRIRSQKVGQLMVGTIVFCSPILGLSMTNYGATSLYLTPFSAAATFLYSPTLLVLILMDLPNRRSSDTGNSGEKDSEHYVTLLPPWQPQPTDTLRTLPWVGRLPVIIYGFLLVILWTAALSISLAWLNFRNTDADFGTGSGAIIPVVWIEIACIPPVIGFIAYSSILCLKERQRLLEQVEKRIS
ncbi:hypothetical protein DFP72DRAFT_901970 [Ephemerocybe angulata]|uniref:Uncharacterized protein n=1 Tax=Ephemerocybe angulata TaxID=980116 RepID=A0A8H6HUP4_9AGAR|nr:hypothetical protein DFP72DRAFT_901970 [Tulosesus angulatus]